MNGEKKLVALQYDCETPSADVLHLPPTRQSAGDKPLHVWRPVPPNSAFVAMGMLITTTEEPPPPGSVRCVPKQWVVESTFKPVKVSTGRSFIRRGALSSIKKNKSVDSVKSVTTGKKLVGLR